MEELTLERMRQMGGQACLKKYGVTYYSKLGKLSGERKRQKKTQQIVDEKADPQNIPIE